MDIKNLTIKANLDHSLLENNAIIAPVHKNEKIGTVSVQLAQDNLGYLQKDEGATTDLLTKTAVEKANVFELLWKKITNLFA